MKKVKISCARVFINPHNQGILDKYFKSRAFKIIQTARTIMPVAAYLLKKSRLKPPAPPPLIHSPPLLVLLASNG